LSGNQKVLYALANDMAAASEKMNVLNEVLKENADSLDIEGT
jgi:hypothetical protein